MKNGSLIYKDNAPYAVLKIMGLYALVAPLRHTDGEYRVKVNVRGCECFINLLELKTTVNYIRSKIVGALTECELREVYDKLGELLEVKSSYCCVANIKNAGFSSTKRRPVVVLKTIKNRSIIAPLTSHIDGEHMDYSILMERVEGLRVPSTLELSKIKTITLRLENKVCFVLKDETIEKINKKIGEILNENVRN